MVDEVTIKKYLEKMDDVLSKYEPVVKSLDSKGPAEVLPYLYLGDFGDAMNLGQLSDMGITHLLNCAGVSSKVMNNIMSSFSNDPEGRKGYKQLDADDDEDYDMLSHYKEACQYIETARKNDGKALIYCVRGINRSAAICVAYLVVHNDMDLCAAVDAVALARGQVLSNSGFKEQLVKFASDQNKLK